MRNKYFSCYSRVLEQHSFDHLNERSQCPLQILNLQLEPPLFPSLSWLPHWHSETLMSLNHTIRWNENKFVLNGELSSYRVIWRRWWQMEICLGWWSSLFHMFRTFSNFFVHIPLSLSFSLLAYHIGMNRCFMLSAMTGGVPCTIAPLTFIRLY